MWRDQELYDFIADEWPVTRPEGQPPLNILVVDDKVDNRKVAARMLAKLGHRSDTVVNGQEAVDAVTRKDYDAVLMDIQMPVMDGLEATRRIRATVPEQRQPRIIALTANALAGDRERCLEAGMDDYVSKPVDAHRLAAAVAKVVPRAAAAISPDKLNALADSIGRDGLVEVLDVMIREAPQKMGGLVAALQARDASGVRQLAHAMKVHCSLVGQQALFEQLDTLEQQAAGRADARFAAAGPLVQRYGEMMVALANYRAGLS